MGTLKPQLPLGQSTLLQEAVKKFLLAGIDDVRVVLGHRAEEITPLLTQSGPPGF